MSIKTTHSHKKGGFSFLWLLFHSVWVCVGACTDCIFFTHSFIIRHLGCFYVLPILSNAAMNIGVEISIRESSFTSFKYIPRSGIAESLFVCFDFFVSLGIQLFQQEVFNCIYTLVKNSVDHNSYLWAGKQPLRSSGMRALPLHQKVLLLYNGQSETFFKGDVIKALTERTDTRGKLGRVD